VDNVIDSSRYFVLRIIDPRTKDSATPKTALIGIGFEDRDPAFEFKSCLNEYIRYVDRMSGIDSTQMESSNTVLGRLVSFLSLGFS